MAYRSGHSADGEKEEVRVYLDPLYLRVIDDLIKKGYGKNRAEVVRKIMAEWALRYMGKEIGT